jgi:hypothetical protein
MSCICSLDMKRARTECGISGCTGKFSHLNYMCGVQKLYIYYEISFYSCSKIERIVYIFCMVPSLYLALT